MHEESSARMVVYIYWLDPTSHLSSPPPSMTASSSCSILSRFPQTKYDKFDNATTFANPLSQFPPVNPLSPQGFNCSVPGSMECASGYDGFQPHHSNNAGLSSSQLQSNMHGLFNPSGAQFSSRPFLYVQKFKRDPVQFLQARDHLVGSMETTTLSSNIVQIRCVSYLLNVISKFT